MRLRPLALILLCLLVPATALSTGSLVIPNTLGTQPGGTNMTPMIDANYAGIASYVNAREISFGTLAARPAAGTAGRYYLATDQNGGTTYADNGSAWVQIGGPVSGQLAQQLTGLTLANNGSATATFTVAVGAATSDDAVIANRVLMSNTASITKSLAAWAVGSGLGCLDTGAVATFTWYSVFLITRTDTGVVDVLCSTSATAPTMPTNYTKRRRIGSIRTDWSGTASLYFFSQVGDRFRWATTTSTLDVNDAASGTAAKTATLSTPNGVQTEAMLNAVNVNATVLYISELDASDEAPVTNAAPLGSVGSNAALAFAQVRVMTNTAQQIRYRSSGNGQVFVVTIGWIDRRGQQ